MAAETPAPEHARFLCDIAEVVARIERIDPVAYDHSRNDLGGATTWLGPFLTHGVTDTVEVGVRQNVTVAGNEDDRSWNGATTGFADYVFDFDAFRPFVGVSLGYLYGDDTNDTFIGGPEAGIKYYLKDDAFVFGRVNLAPMRTKTE